MKDAMLIVNSYCKYFRWKWKKTKTEIPKIAYAMAFIVRNTNSAKPLSLIL